MGEQDGDPVLMDLEFLKGTCPTIAMQIHLPDGSVLADTPVTFDLRFFSRVLNGWFEMPNLTTDERGRLELSLSLGKGVYHITLTVEGYPPVTVENILIFDKDPGEELKITLPPQ